jgi:hypothetical protein
MQTLFNAYDPRILRALAAHGAVGVIIDHNADPQGDSRRFLQSYPGAVLQETHPGWSSYRVPASAAGDLVPEASGTPIPIKGVDAFPSPPHAARAIDGNLKTRWSGGVQRSAADFTIELAEPGRVHQLVVELAEFMTDFPVKLQIETSPDGAAWETVLLRDTALEAYYAAMRHPKQIPMVFPIERDHVRFLRLKQLGWGTHDWSIAELRALR